MKNFLKKIIKNRNIFSKAGAAGCPGFVAEWSSCAVQDLHGSVCAPDRSGGIGGGVLFASARCEWVVCVCVCVWVMPPALAGWLAGEAVVDTPAQFLHCAAGPLCHKT